MVMVIVPLREGRGSDQAENRNCSNQQEGRALPLPLSRKAWCFTH